MFGVIPAITREAPNEFRKATNGRQHDGCGGRQTSSLNAEQGSSAHIKLPLSGLCAPPRARRLRGESCLYSPRSLCSPSQAKGHPAPQDRSRQARSLTPVRDMAGADTEAPSKASLPGSGGCAADRPRRRSRPRSAVRTVPRTTTRTIDIGSPCELLMCVAQAPTAPAGATWCASTLGRSRTRR